VYTHTLYEKLRASCDKKLPEALIGDARKAALDAIHVKAVTESAKHVRVVKNSQYSFVEKNPEHQMTEEETESWKVT